MNRRERRAAKPERTIPVGRGPGKYDELATYVRERTNARGVVLFVLTSEAPGSGFSVQFTDAGVLVDVPEMLRSLADQVEADLESHLAEMAAKSGGSA
jgi:hypothetical protein